MTKKIAFISKAIIKLTKEDEEKIKPLGELQIEYKHPVLYITKQQKKTKDYIYIYCGKPTYVIMKIKKSNLEAFTEAIETILSNAGIDTNQIDLIKKEVHIYCTASNVIEEIYRKITKKATETTYDLLFTLSYYDPTLRKAIKKCLIRAIIKQTTKNIIRTSYHNIPQELKETLTIREWTKIIYPEINQKSIMKHIYKAIKNHEH